MPRYFYTKLRPILKKFASDNKLPFKVSGVLEIFTMNYETLKNHSGKGKNIGDTQATSKADVPSGPCDQ